MRITPHDIRQQQFSSKMLKGYDPHEVDAFLDDVAEDYESVLKETALLREQIPCDTSSLSNGGTSPSSLPHQAHLRVMRLLPQ